MPHSPIPCSEMSLHATESPSTFFDTADMQTECSDIPFNDFLAGEFSLFSGESATYCPDQHAQHSCSLQSQPAQPFLETHGSQSKIAQEKMALQRALSQSCSEVFPLPSSELRNADACQYFSSDQRHTGPVLHLEPDLSSVLKDLEFLSNSLDMVTDTCRSNSSRHSDIACHIEVSTTASSDEQEDVLTDHQVPLRRCVSQSCSPSLRPANMKLGVRRALSQEEKIMERRRRNREASSRSYYNRKARVEKLETTLKDEKRRVTALFQKELQLRKENASLKAQFLASIGQ